MEQQAVILEPKTAITSFDGITWGIQKAVGGAVAALLFGDNKEAKNQFYKSPTSRVLLSYLTQPKILAFSALVN